MTRALPPIVVVGNPGHRRVEWFVDAAIAEGVPPPQVISHADLIEAPERIHESLPDGPALIRLESVGQSHAVARLLLRAGHDGVEAPASRLAPDEIEQATPSRFELRAPRQLHAGYVRYLRGLGAALRERPECRAFASTASIEPCFDKDASADWLLARGALVPQRLGAAASADELEQRMDEAGATEAWVKLPYASSASGLALVRRRRGRRAVFSTVALVDGRFFNTRRVRRYDEPHAQAAVLGFLLREGARVEHGVDKTHVLGRFADLRVLVVAGKAAFVVARGSRHPITNLHLGGVELPLPAFLAQVPKGAYEEALRWCVGAAEALDVVHLGLDVAFDRRTGAPVVLEMNAFGDLLPRAESDGLDPYRYQVRAVLRAAQRGAFG